MRKCVKHSQGQCHNHRFVPYRSYIHNKSKTAEANLMKFQRKLNNRMKFQRKVNQSKKVCQAGNFGSHYQS